MYCDYDNVFMKNEVFMSLSGDQTHFSFDVFHKIILDYNIQ